MVKTITKSLMLLSFIIGGISIFISLVSASDVLVWQGQYYTGITFNTGTFQFNFSVYDALTGGNLCYSNTTNLTTGSFGEWRTEQHNVSSLCNNASKDYYLNININGIDQSPRRRLVVWDFLRKNSDESTAGILQSDSGVIAPVLNVTQVNTVNLTATGSGFFSYLGDLVSKITKLFVQDVDFNGTINGTGNIMTSGNITAANVFIPQYIYTVASTVQHLDSANVFQNITYNDTDIDLANGISHNPLDNTNDTFTIAESGIYQLTFRDNFKDTSGTTHHVNGRIARNGVEIDGSNVEVDITNANLDFGMTNAILANLTSGDEINFQWTATSTTVSLNSDATNALYKSVSIISINRIA